jgi:hypothetical protein
MADKRSEDLLAEVIDRYLGSGDFNGLFIRGADQRGAAAETLIGQGAVEVIGEEDFPNPHIRPWKNRRSGDEQIASLRAAVAGETYGICLYPTSAALADMEEVRVLADRPYTQRLAAGAGQLDVAFFRTDVLESYRNDPRFTFRFNDVGARASISDEVYEDKTQPAADKVSVTLGFAYRQPLNQDAPIVRFVAAFLRDVARLSPEHQRRWETYEVAGEDIKPHPIWLAEAMGEWIDRIGPFDALFRELAALNELYESAFGTPLLRATERPDDFGWILRPSRREFDDFIQTLDKLLSDNMRHAAFDSAGIPSIDETGQQIGSLNRLDQLLERARVPEHQRKEVLKPLRDVRTARSKPAHALRQNITDETFIRRQAEILQQVTQSVESLRRFWQNHPRNRDWIPPGELETSQRLWL